MRKIDLDFVKCVVNYYNENHSTVRKTAKHFKISKSCVHYYLTKVMPNPTSAKIIEKNKLERAFSLVFLSILCYYYIIKR